MSPALAGNAHEAYGASRASAASAGAMTTAGLRNVMSSVVDKFLFSAPMRSEAHSSSYSGLGQCLVYSSSSQLPLVISICLRDSWCFYTIENVVGLCGRP